MAKKPKVPKCVKCGNAAKRGTIHCRPCSLGKTADVAKTYEPARGKCCECGAECKWLTGLCDSCKSKVKRDKTAGSICTRCQNELAVFGGMCSRCRKSSAVEYETSGVSAVWSGRKQSSLPHGEYVVPFGKHAGQSLSSCPRQYVHWLASHEESRTHEPVFLEAIRAARALELSWQDWSSVPRDCPFNTDEADEAEDDIGHGLEQAVEWLAQQIQLVTTLEPEEAYAEAERLVLGDMPAGHSSRWRV